ncbi:hypothetical protein SK128_007195 [Halocaridina rubra]|uniref:HORMA domain-containing protein n=1 Tax=Halocaridina rubra TaxID=373956 RepID=A0AAN8ZYG2_HALRR
MEMDVEGRRRRGRPKLRWKDRLKEDLRERQLEEEQWSSMFPAIQHSEQGSADHVKMLIFVGFSCITFLRNIFPKEAYEIYNMDDVLVSLISEDNNRLCPKMFVELLYSAFEAIDKKYLRELSLVISDENCAIAQEVYTFSIQYHTNGNLSLATYVDNKRRDVNRKLHIKHSTLDLIQNIMMLTQSMSLLPKEITLCFYLSYYNNVTPKGYEPRGYSSVTSLNIGLHDTCFLQYGSVKTLFHSLQLYSLVKQTLAEHLLLKGSSQDQKVARANSERKKKTNNNVNHVPGLRCVKPRGSGKKRIIKTLASISSLPVTLVSCQKDVESPLIKLSSEWKSASQCETNDTTTKTHNVSKSTSVRYSCSPSIMVSELSGFLIQSDMNCPCGLGGEEDIMLLCNHCGFYQHGVCFGILNSRDIPMTHVCERCAQIGRSCTDSFLQKSSTQLVREFCTLRRIYAHLSKVRGRHTIGSLSQKFGLSRGLERRISAILKKEKAFFINDQPS